MISVFWLLFAAAAAINISGDDKDLAQRIRNGDHNAFKTFFDTHFKSLFRFLISRGIDKATAEDLIQKAFVIIWEKRAGIDENKSLRAYLYRTAYTRMLNEIKYNTRFDDDAEFPQPEGMQSPEDNVQYSQLMKTIHEVVSNMPEKRGMVFDFCFSQQFSYKETAEAMGINIKTVENHMGMALKEVRYALKEYRVENLNEK